MDRRLFVRGSLAAAAAAALSPRRAGATDWRQVIATVPLADISPYAAADNYERYNRHFCFDADLSRLVVERYWRAFTALGDADVGEAAVIMAFLWWRTLASPAERVKVSIGARRMAEQFRQRFPERPVGPLWTAVFTGTEALSRGLLNALHLVPEFQKNLAAAAALDPSYFFGLATVLQAKMFIKVPPFPMSIGDVDRGLELLEQARPWQQGKFALWYLFGAEAALIKGDRDAAFAVLDRIATEVRPSDTATAYLADATLHDAEELRRAVLSGSYDRYLWDPLLTPARSGRNEV